MINNRFKIICFITVLAVGLLGFCGCGEKKVLSLEEMVVQNPEMAKTIEEGLAEIEASGVTQSVNYKGNTIELTLKYEKAYNEDDVKAFAKAFEENESIYESACNQAIANIKKSTELEKVKIKISVVNGDSSEIWSKTYKGE